ncbi:MAG: nickel pincer cofactor biosynthesis protein LarC [Phycisphaeraceae bacterium]|nr:nickel pincer cofactor biosynthesis protein LarC [Phycisphaeraceae bacterium]
MIGYLDLPSGLSGDMMLGCLVDAGWPVQALRDTIAGLGLDAKEWSIDAASVMKGPLRATLVRVEAAEGHHHRHLKHIVAIINGAQLSDSIKQKAIAVFTRLAHAEAKVHGTTPEKIHFHEVGAVDAIIDIVGSVAGLEALGVTQLFASAPPLGSGWAQTAHGKIPLPAPATLELLAAVGAPSRPAPGEGEWLTPTGAALLVELATFQQPHMNVQRIATGAGSRDCDWPNVARLWLGEVASSPVELVQLETNIDDMNPQLYESVCAALLAAGARDVWLTPVQMKKGRPGVVLSVLAPAAQQAAMIDLMLRQTTTLGVRAFAVLHRGEAEREMRQLDTPHGQVRVKLKQLDGQLIGATPEYDDCLKLAEQSGQPLKRVYDDAFAAAQRLLDGTIGTPPSI